MNDQYNKTIADRLHKLANSMIHKALMLKEEHKDKYEKLIKAADEVKAWSEEIRGEIV